MCDCLYRGSLSGILNMLNILLAAGWALSCVGCPRGVLEHIIEVGMDLRRVLQPVGLSLSIDSHAQL